MLPSRAAPTAQNVGGTWFKYLFQWFYACRYAFFDRPSPKLHSAFIEKRHTNNDIEPRRITMPTNRSSGRIVGY